MKSGYFVERPRRVLLYNCSLIATDSNYLRCHALLTALHFPLETTWSCKQNRKERYWGQQFWQMERDISVRPTEMTRPVTVDHLQSWSRIFRSDKTEMVRSIWCTNRNYRNFGLNGPIFPVGPVGILVSLRGRRSKGKGKRRLNFGWIDRLKPDESSICQRRLTKWLNDPLDFRSLDRSQFELCTYQCKSLA